MENGGKIIKKVCDKQIIVFWYSVHIAQRTVTIYLIHLIVSLKVLVCNKPSAKKLPATADKPF